ncbi:MAG: hypothetical protein J6W13_07200 [Salinivirgaceae bacterium]|nr:hypothetical protein [Salinivirgaceae bacterium]
MSSSVLKQGLFRISTVLYARNNASNISIKQVIRKIIEDVVVHRSPNKQCSVSELVALVNEEHGIMLSHEEVGKIIQDSKFKDNFNWFIDNDNCLQVSLTTKRKVFLENEAKKKNLFDYIVDFVKINNLSDAYVEKFKLFFYGVFATNLEGYKRLLNGESIIEVSETTFDEEEKSTINHFLNWDVKEKNQAVFDLANYALEYCMLVNKKDSSFDINYLKNKRLYLDTNILFRSIGVNGEDREKRTEQFLSKFSQVQQQLFITKETDAEFKNTLNYYIGKLNQSFTPSCKVKPEVYVETVSIDGFYKNYCKWRLGKRNDSVADYKLYLLAKYEEVLKRFSILKDTDKPYSFDEKEKLIKEYASQIIEFNKDKQYTAAETDAKNIIWIEQKRKGENNDIYKVKDFLISSDQYLRRWDYDRNTNDVPIVMMPSQWLSLILRYMERTENDYKSFVNFLNIKISNQQLSEEQMFSVINGISEMTSDIEQQRYLLKAFINEDLEKTIQNLENDAIEERAMEFAKTTLERKIEDLEKQQLDNKNDIESLKKEVLRKNQESDNKDDEINKYKSQLEEKNNEIEDKDMVISRHELANWKRPKYWLFSIFLLVNIIILTLYFTAQKWNFNYPAILLNKIDDLSGIRNAIAMGLLCFVHGAFALFSLNGIICLCMMKPADDKKRWLLKLFDKHIVR